MKLQCGSNAPLAIIVASLVFMSAIPVAWADTMYWTNSSTAGNFSDPAKWSGGIAPGAADTASFTNTATDPSVNWTADATTANASISTLGRTVTLAIGSWSWYVPGQFVAAADAGRTCTVVLSSGNLVVTNTAGTGTFSLSTAPKGTFTMNGGSVQADVFCAGTNATLNLNAGSLTTGHGVTATNAAVTIGATAGKIMAWNMTGGTNQFYGGTLALGGNPGQTGVVAVTGAGTSLMITNLAILTVGANITGNGQLTVASNATAYVGTNVTINVNGGGSKLAVLEGGGMTVVGLLNVGSSATDSNNTLLVSGANAILSVTNTLGIGSAGKLNQLIVTNAAILSGCGTNELRLGYSGNGVVLSNRAVITGAGSVVTNFGLITIGQQNGGNRFEVTAGGQVFNTNANLAIGNNPPGSNNTVVIAGANSAWWTKSLSMAGGWGNQLYVTNGGGARIVGRWHRGRQW